MVVVQDPHAGLVADVVMPHMKDFTRSGRLVETHPETRVLFMSDQADQSEAVGRRREKAGEASRHRPFTVDRLLLAIRDRLDSSSDRDTRPG